VLALQFLKRDASDVFMLALKSIRKVQEEHEQLLKQLDALARAQADECPLRLIEDIVRVPSDVAQMLTLIRPCLAASAFLGHCLARSGEAISGQFTDETEKRLQ
jgi:hypothetical protein